MSSDNTSTRDYRGDGIVVHWQAERCMHSGICAAELGEVFRPKQRPWVDPSAASADRIAAAIDLCPSGALSYTRTEPQESDMSSTDDGTSNASSSDDVTVVTVTTDGPNMLKGNIEIRNEDGELIKSAKRVALCRCGASENKPFCDGSHTRVGFSAPSPDAD